MVENLGNKNNMRKIIQISTDSHVWPDSTTWQSTTALCDDGTVWELEWNPFEKDYKWWTKLPDIPQTED